jgi:hypothetical protein
MPSLNEQELITALAAWVGKLKDPYSKARSAPIPPVTLQSSSPNAWLEIKQINKNRLEVTCIHRVIEQDDDNNLEEIRRECAQFNSLMERVRLPVYIWEDRDKSEFQLRWQETMLTQADLKYVQRFFEQSLYLANALQSRLGWALSDQAQPVSH